MMRHAVSHAGRNCYCAGRHTQEWGAWSGLVVLGLAQFGNLINDGCDQYFHVTDAGIEYLRKVGADAMTTPIDTVVLRKLLASCDAYEEQCKMQREVDSEWGGELRRKLGVARGMLDSVADDLEEVDHGPEAAHWEQTVREIRQILCETADMSDERRPRYEKAKVRPAAPADPVTAKITPRETCFRCGREVMPADCAVVAEGLVCIPCLRGGDRSQREAVL